MKIAIFGAGQLAMMMVQADHEKKHKFTVIDPSPNPPASHYQNIFNHNMMIEIH